MSPYIHYLSEIGASQSAKITYNQCMETNTAASFRVEFNVLGQNIVIKNKEEAALAEIAIKVVNEKLQEIQLAKPMLGPQQVAVLALLEIAGNLVRDRKAIDDYRSELDRMCSVVMREINQ